MDTLYTPSICYYSLVPVLLYQEKFHFDLPSFKSKSYNSQHAKTNAATGILNRRDGVVVRAFVSQSVDLGFIS